MQSTGQSAQYITNDSHYPQGILYTYLADPPVNPRYSPEVNGVPPVYTSRGFGPFIFHSLEILLS